MRNKEFREIQVSSSALVVIFIAILILGVFIFLLGINVGKKQVQMAGPTTLLVERPIENVRPQTTVPVEDRNAGTQAQNKPEETSAVPQTNTIPPPPSGDTGSGNTTGKTAAETGQEPVEKTKPPETKPAPAKAADTGTPTAKAGAYYIQVGALNDRTQASSLAARFRKQGYPVVVLDPLPSDKKTVYRVRIGGFGTRDQAAQTLTKLNAAAKKKTGYYITKD